MNVALPALIVFLLLLPGFIFRTRLKRAERTSLDFSPFGQVAAEAVMWAVFAHLLWLAVSYWVFRHQLEPAVLMKLLSSDATGQARATELVGRDWWRAGQSRPTSPQSGHRARKHRSVSMTSMAITSCFGTVKQSP
jgi:hypothetical protein